MSEKVMDKILKCLCLVEFEDVEEIALLAFDHQGNMDDWLITKN